MRVPDLPAILQEETMFYVIFTLFFLGIAALFVWRGIAFGKRHTWIYSAVRTGAALLAIVLGVLLSAILSKLIVGAVFGSMEKSGAFGSFQVLTEEIPTLPDAIVALLAMILAPLLFYVLFFVLKAILGVVSTTVSYNVLCKEKEKGIVVAESVVAEESSEPVAEESEESAPEESGEEIAEATAEPIEESISESVEPAEESEKETRETVEEIPAEEPEVKLKKKDALRFDGKRNPWGMVLGGVCGLLLYFAVMSPVIGILGVADDAIATVAVMTDSKPIDLAAGVTDGITNNPIAKATDTCGGNLIYSGLTTYSVGDHRVTLNRETAFVRSVGKAIGDYRNDSLDRAAVANSLRQAGDAFEKTSLIPTLVPEFLSAANTQWSEGRTFHGIKKIGLGDNLKGITDPLLDLLVTADYETIKGDAATSFEILALTVERGGLRGGLSGKNLLKEQSIAEGAMCELLINPHLSPLVGDVLAYSFDEIGHTVGAHFDGDPIKDPSVVYASMDQIKVDSSQVQNPEQEAAVLAEIIVRTLVLAEDMDNNMSASGCLRGMGPVLDLFARSETVGEESTAIFLTCILQAEKIYDEIGFTLQEATDLAATMNGDYGSVSANGAVNTYALMMRSVANGVQMVESSSNQEDYKEPMNTLMADLNRTSAKILSQMMSSSVMTKRGVSGESAAPTSSLISSIFTDLAAEKEAGMPEDEYMQESAAVMNLTDLAMNSGKAGSNRTFGENSATGVSAEEFVANIRDSKVVSGSMKKQVFEEESSEPNIDPLKKNSKLGAEDTAELTEAMNARWAQEENKSDAETVKTYQAIGAMMGMTVEFTSSGTITLM